MVGGTDGEGDGSVSDDAEEQATPAIRRRSRKERRTTTGSVG
jgi:hypothetical protein